MVRSENVDMIEIEVGPCNTWLQWPNQGQAVKVVIWLAANGERCEE